MSIEVKPFSHEAEIPLDGGMLRLVVNFRAIDRLESLLGVGMDQLLGQLSSSTSMATKFLWAFTREHHDDLTFDQLAGLQFSKDTGQLVMVALGDLVKRAFNFASDEPQEGEQGHPPPKSSVGRSPASSRNGARQGSARRTSGRKRQGRS